MFFYEVLLTVVVKVKKVQEVEKIWKTNDKNTKLNKYHSFCLLGCVFVHDWTELKWFKQFDLKWNKRSQFWTDCVFVCLCFFTFYTLIKTIWEFERV